MTTEVTDQAGTTAEEQPQAVPSQDATAPTTPTFDLSSFDGIKAAMETAPALRQFLEKQLLDRENTVRQRLQSEARRDLGSVERAMQYQQEVVQKIQSGVPIEEAFKDAPSFVRANADYWKGQVLRGVTEQAMSLASPEQKEILQSLLDSAIDDPDGITKVAEQTLQAVIQKVRSDALLNLTLEDAPEGSGLVTVPQGSKLREELRALVQKEADMELKARQTEARAREVQSPSVPMGEATTPITRQYLDSMSPDQRLAYFNSLPDAERESMWGVVMSED